MNTEQILNHRGSLPVTRQQLELVPVPQKTDTYEPLAYQELVRIAIDKAESGLGGYTLVEENHTLAKGGQRYFGDLTFRNGIADDMGLRVGIRTSYDKTLAHAMVTGAGVFVCSNGMFNGKIRVVRRHTKESIEDVHTMFGDAIGEARKDFYEAVDVAGQLKDIRLEEDDGFKIIGVAAGRGILSPTQTSQTFREWKKPRHEEFANGNAWGVYNAGTEALKTTVPEKTMERHRQWHDLFLEQVLGEELPN